MVLIIGGGGADGFQLQKHLHHPLIPTSIRPRKRCLAIFGLRLIENDVLSFLKLMEAEITLQDKEQPWLRGRRVEERGVCDR